MKKKLMFMLVVGTLCLVSCQNDKDPVTPDTIGRIKIEPIITRATEVNFEDGDDIGLTIARSNGSYHATNKLFTYDGSVFTSDMIWYEEAGDESDLIAYYPYSAEGIPTAFTIATDQTGTGYSKSDLMGSSKSGVLPTANSVSMVFKHLLTNVVIHVDNESGDAITSVILSGAIPTASVDLENLFVEVDETVETIDIKAQEVTAGSEYRMIVVPQKVAFKMTVTTSGGKTLSQTLASADLKSGIQYQIDARVLADDLVISLSGEIENWGDGGKLGSGVSFEEYAGYFIYDGDTYNTVTLSNGQAWMAEPLRYIPDGYTPSVDPTTDAHIWYPYALQDDNNFDGTSADRAIALTDETSIRNNGYLYDIYVALNGVNITPDNCYDYEGMQGICPPGWHIPTRADYLGLCGLSNKNAFGETGNFIDKTALFYDEGYGGGKRTLFNDANWNYVLTGIRQQTNFAATGSYQLTQLWSGNTSLPAEMYGTSALTYMMSSTCYKPIYSSTNPDELTNIQFFAQMTTFTNLYPEGRISIAYASIKAGMQLRCVKD